MNLTLIASLISAVAAGLAGFGLAWRLQTATIDQMELEQANERISLQRAARATMERQQSAVVTAQNAAAERRRALAIVRRDGDAALVGLRDATAAAMRAASESLDACNRVVATHGDILAECSSTLQKVAGDADQCISDTKTLIEAWPD
ncbi:MAG: hypothetical protein AUJ20_01365 [Comamonadaceae bacterium CG1_02_60_18]|nr:MAG: hypothetical protein AUJ20_01365 [Comamonadaceae bacterium CG1_02_60_18]